MLDKPTSSFKTELGKAIREEREAQGLSLRKFGLMLNMDYKHIHQIEHGQANPTTDTLASIAAGLNVPLTRLVARAEGFHRTSASSYEYAIAEERGARG